MVVGLLIERCETQSPVTRPESLERMPDAHWSMPRTLVNRLFGF
jgi:hypothetical protein